MSTGRRIFLAHAREDKARVRELHADLKARGLDPWLDEVDLVPGQIWKEEIPKAIRQAGVFVACLSSRSVSKVGYVQNEFRLALSAFGERPPGSIFLIPVRLDECDVPDLQIPDRGLSLRDIQWVDLWQESGFDRLVSAIERALGRASIKKPTARKLGTRYLEPAAKTSALDIVVDKEILDAVKEAMGQNISEPMDSFGCDQPFSEIKGWLKDDAFHDGFLLEIVRQIDRRRRKLDHRKYRQDFDDQFFDDYWNLVAQKYVFTIRRVAALVQSHLEK